MTKPNFTTKFCDNCTHYNSWYTSGSMYEPPDGGWECTVKDAKYRKTIDRLIEIHDVNSAIWCKHYEEKMIDNCPTCGKTINQPQHTWDIWSNAWDEGFAVCSKECQQTEATKAKKHFEEMEKEYYL